MTDGATNMMPTLDTNTDSDVHTSTPGAGGGVPPTYATKTALTPAAAGKASSSILPRKTYAELQEEAKSLSFLDFRITHADGRNDSIDRKHLSDDDFSTFVHDIMKIPKEICVAYDYFPGSQNMKIIQIKADADISNFTPTKPVPFGEYLIEIRSSKSNVTKVTFLYAGLDIPNEEILNLCDYYGEVLSIENVKMTNAKNKGDRSAKRVVWMKLSPNKVMNNYYWLESIVPGRAASRVLVLHEGQAKQCNHCLKADLNCPAGAEGRQCRTFNKTPKKDAASYMLDLKRETGYKSLREKHNQQFPPLSGSEQPIYTPSEEPLYKELQEKVEELSVALATENEKAEAAENLLVKERLKADTLHSQRLSVTNTLDNLIVDCTNENPSAEIASGSKLDLLLTMRAENTIPGDPSEYESWAGEIEKTVDVLNELLVDQSGSAQALQEKCIETIIDKCGSIMKGKRRRLSLSSASTPLLSSAGNAHKLLNSSPSGRGRTGSRGARGRGSLSAPSRSPSVKRSSQSIQPKETKIPKVSA